MLLKRSEILTATFSGSFLCCKEWNLFDLLFPCKESCKYSLHMFADVSQWSLLTFHIYLISKRCLLLHSKFNFQEKEIPYNLSFVCILGKLGEANSEKSEQHVHRAQYPTSTEGNVLLIFCFQNDIFSEIRPRLAYL